jgi:gluconolactonase
LTFAILTVLLVCPARTQEVEVAGTLAFTEGPTADKDGNLFFTDQKSDSIMRLAVDGTISRFRQQSNNANGLVFDSQWRLLACESGDPKSGTPARVTRTDMASGRIEVLIDQYQGKRLNGPNDVTFDNRGRIYFTDRPSAPPSPQKSDVDGQAESQVTPPGVYRIDLDGRVTKILSAPDTLMPNGLIISPDDRTFYLVEANPAEKAERTIRAYDLRPDGSINNMRVFHNFYPGRSGDGMSIDINGNLYVAAGLHLTRKTSETLDTRPGIHVFSPAGELLKYIPIPEDLVTNCAFGGKDLKTLFVTAGKTVFRVHMDVEGTRR